MGWLADRLGIHVNLGAPGRAIEKVGRKVGHGVGKVLDNKYTKMALAGGLAATGVGLGPAALIMGGAGMAGGALKEGGGLKDALAGGARDGIGTYAGGKLMQGVGSLAGKAGFAPSSSAATNAIPNAVADASQSVGANALAGVGKAAGGEWWKNKDVLMAGLNVAGSGAKAVLDQKNQQGARDMQQQQMDREEMRYRDEERRRQEVAAYMMPILQRLQGQAPQPAFQAPRYGGY